MSGPRPPLRAWILAALLAGCGVKAYPRPPEPEPARPSPPASEKRP